MLDDSDYLARKCAYYQGYKDMAVKVYIELGGEGELSEKTMEILFGLMREADSEYANYQHQYIDAIGGNEKLKV